MMISYGKRSALLAAAMLAAFATYTSAASAAEKKIVRTAAASEETTGEKPTSLYEMLTWGRSKTSGAATETTTEPRSRAAKSAAGAGRTELRALIAKHAKAEGIPAELAEAVVSVESGFNPRARGRAGEVGLMQIKPSTARAIGYRGTTNNLYDPDTNLAWGMRYLATAYRLAGGDTCGAILRYNGGHAARKMTGRARQYCGEVNRYVASL